MESLIVEPAEYDVSVDAEIIPVEDLFDEFYVPKKGGGLKKVSGKEFGEIIKSSTERSARIEGKALPLQRKIDVTGSRQ